MPSTTVNEFVHFGIMSESGRPVLNPGSSCCSSLVTSWTTFLPQFQGEKRVFLVILAVAKMVFWTMRKKGLYDDANFSHRDLILFFRHQLRVKIRCDRKRLDHIKFDQRWVNAASLVVRKGTTVVILSLKQRDIFCVCKISLCNRVAISEKNAFIP